ncbi:TetR/AcrR family transcriptional regulator [Microcella frigidaquae]|uniref:AcrR family transcriptional regulator n=1 Tax=Microcella frigidaquae TaxID=424758 RepID=A0A840XAU1_9MICO|nr:TetR/AcrR family transcriptional regulator [Microcella frigidaquae]MBB5618294.1 AcrR family transcriptional regulator [Microcella frigidaquae]NHN44800.1 TetR/AcrR family transcriptional regulator [Microcella frigidaquae]
MPDRSRYHHGALRDALVDAGEALARAEGLEGVTVRRIAAACGVSAAAVYRHFPSGDHLIAAVAQRAREIMARDMFARLDAAADKPPIDRLREVGESYIALALAEPRLFSLVSMPMTTPPDRPDDPNAADLVRDIVLELEPPGAVDEQRVASRMMLAQASAHGLAVILRDFVPDAGARAMLIAGVLDRVGVGLEA